MNKYEKMMSRYMSEMNPDIFEETDDPDVYNAVLSPEKIKGFQNYLDRLKKEDEAKAKKLNTKTNKGMLSTKLDTPAERDFLISVMTGARTMDKEAIMRLTRLRQEIATDAIQKWNKKVQNGSLDNYIILNRKLKDDGSDEFKAKFAQAKNDFIQEVPEMYKGTWARPVEGVFPVINNGEATEYVSWDGRYYDSENKEISIEDLDKILNPKGGE